ncbi:unnamed protein product [Aspergillus oryzae]|uniref:Unnamed protein product n=1 Tax=Aspergillus oryzae var. brunneus TaxID=332754 RepID=A0ABQ6KEZ3_ASPOZ|nr:unnamed protein product [Aspergillus oryzae]GMF83508.1 unnamed protein product [Aspergillus oryzae]GMG41956.1 unnamed protein product [Aspergillus oryzae var. brunneus]
MNDDNGTRLNMLQSHILQLRQGVQASSLGKDTQQQLRQLLGLSENAAKRMAQQRILNALAFRAMRRRINAVEEAHQQTFRWMFEEKSTPGTEHDNCRDRIPEYKRDVAARLFKDWLSRGQGIFHITGKLGSGKSTLMKFLYNHPQTRQELEHWAGMLFISIISAILYNLSFFFWKPGHELQNSIKGLLQSILHDLLAQCPDLITVVFPKHWDQVYGGPFSVPSKLEFQPNEIREAFRRSIEDGALYHKCRFCFFIDGLDEYQETNQDDFKTMVEMLWSWTDIAPEGVKICVSSREYNVFLNGFPPDRRIRIQDLTRLDMERYVEDKMKDVDHQTKERLISRIVRRARGIFLWLKSLPDELESLLDHLLNSIKPSIRQKAYQTFQLVLRAKDINSDGRVYGLNLSTYSFLEELDRDPDFILKADLPCAPMDSKTRSTRMEGARKRLNGYCKGLVESREEPPDRPLLNGLFCDHNTNFITFTHRSVVEILERPVDKSKLSLHLEGFDCDLTLLRLFLANICFCLDQSHHQKQNKISFVGMQFLLKKSKEGSDPAPYGFREALEQLMNVVYSQWWSASFYVASRLSPQTITHPPNTLCELQPLTFWELFLLDLTAHPLIGSINRQRYDSRETSELLSDTIELFLNLGASPDFCITLKRIYREPIQPLKCKTVEFAFGGMKRNFILSHGVYVSLIKFAATRGYKLCLKDLIEYLHLKDEEKTKLLMLAEKCSLRRASVQHDPANPVNSSYVFMSLFGEFNPISNVPLKHNISSSVGSIAVILVFMFWPTWISSMTTKAVL